ncbi:NUDIX hydrolase [Bacillus thuringiensis]|uniref:NUDIX hydrolase n=1 Tax=Bacillus thuringiensis TaxID=1428 RepID=UPI0033399216
MLKECGERKIVVSNSHAKVWSIPVEQDGVKDEPFLLCERKDSVTVFVRNELNQILLVQQHRFACDRSGWELPQGAIEEGEQAIVAAKRELLEETSYLAEKGYVIGELYEAADWCTTSSKIIVFNTTRLSLEDRPELKCRWFSLEEIKEYIKQGTIFDSMTISALFLESIV